MNHRQRKGLRARDRGHQEEARARAHLEAHGLRLMGRNVRYRCGELDLIMRDGDCLVFVEVRYRNRSDWGGAAASITPAKQQRLIRAAQRHLQHYPWPGPCRFDVVALDGDGVVNWIVNAIET
ncbi:MAG: YraN family protein [Ectothiorhodospiraceae bacterium]|nr:YraN family protein [Ectothiorhodospiraceae bacterium]